MKLFTRLLVAAALVSAVTGTATAQVLNTLDVQRLVADGTPNAHGALAKHFIAVAEVYTADAARYSALALAGGGNPNRVPASDPRLRRERQAAEAMRMAERARDVAQYHQLLSAGFTPSRIVEYRPAFDSGLGARLPTTREVADAAAAARTPADHHVLVEYFMIVADDNRTAASNHAAMANSFRVGGQRRGSEFAAMHCDRSAEQAREAAKKASAAAELHRQLAAVG